MTAAVEFPARPALSLVPPTPDPDLAAALRATAVRWQADLEQAAEEAEWQRRRGVFLALLPSASRPALPPMPLDPILEEAGWARAVPVPVAVPPSPLLHQTAVSGGKPGAKFHALGPTGATACMNLLVGPPGLAVDDVPDVQRCQAAACRAAWGAGVAS